MHTQISVGVSHQGNEDRDDDDGKAEGTSTSEGQHGSHKVREA